MNLKYPLRAAVCCLALDTFPASAAPVTPLAVQHHAAGATAVAATVHPLATEAALNALRKGGNAVDAAVAAGLTLGVVDGHNSGIGGGCFMLIRLPGGEFVALDGREMAPAKAHRDMFLRDGKADGDLSTTGPLASAIPGSLAVYDRALKEHGKLALADLILPAAAIAENGFPIDAAWARKLRSAAQDIAKFPYSASILLRPDGSPMEEGEVVFQPDLAVTYRGIAEKGIDYFYRGPVAEKTAAWMEKNGGIITAGDFENYRVAVREPIRSEYRGHTIVGFPPPSSGGVHVAQILNILANFEVAKLPEIDRLHLFIEAEKLAFADRAHWLGDPDFADVPRGLLDKEYAAQLAGRITLEKATAVPSHGTPPRSGEDLFKKHTTHFTAADAEGCWVACTATVNTGFGSKVLIPGTGVILNNQMDDFSIQPGVPNAFKLVGAEANAVAPGKRPLSSMSPTIVLKDGEPVFSVGGAGGPTIITQSALAIARRLDLDLPLLDCIALPRVHHQWSPDEVRVEKDLAPALRDALEKRGHALSETTRLGTSQAIALRPDGTLEAASDPRNSGRADGF